MRRHRRASPHQHDLLLLLSHLLFLPSPSPPPRPPVAPPRPPVLRDSVLLPVSAAVHITSFPWFRPSSSSARTSHHRPFLLFVSAARPPGLAYVLFLFVPNLRSWLL